MSSAEFNTRKTNRVGGFYVPDRVLEPKVIEMKTREDIRFEDKDSVRVIKSHLRGIRFAADNFNFESGWGLVEMRRLLAEIQPLLDDLDSNRKIINDNKLNKS